jgi:hypothetical protein
MYCAICGMQIVSTNALYCHGCGKALQDMDATHVGVSTSTLPINVAVSERGEHNNSSLGKASFIISMVTGVIFVITLVITGTLLYSTSEVLDSEASIYIVFGFIIFLVIFADIVGLVLGIIGLKQNHQNKTLAVLGTIFNSITLMVLAGLFILGSVV